MIVNISEVVKLQREEELETNLAFNDYSERIRELQDEGLRWSDAREQARKEYKDIGYDF